MTKSDLLPNKESTFTRLINKKWTLGAQTLSRRITAVLGAAYALFMCHCNIPPT